MAIDKEALDQLLAGREPQELVAKDGLLDELKKALSERMRPPSSTIIWRTRRPRALATGGMRRVLPLAHAPH